MAADGGGFSGIILPQQFPSPGQVMQQGIQNGENNIYKAYSLMERKKAQDEADAYKKINLIDDAVDANKFHTGADAVDNFTTQQLNSLKQDFTEKAKTLSPTDLYGYINQKLTPVIQQDAAVKNIVTKGEAIINEKKKDYPNLDYGSVHNAFMNNVAKGYLQYDNNGNVVGYKRTIDMPTGRDFAGELLSDENIGQFVNDTSPLDKHVQSFKDQQNDYEYYTDKKGVRHDLKYQTVTNPFSQVDVDENGRPTGVSVARENIDGFNDANGKPVNLLPKDKMDLIFSNPQAKISFLKKWNDVKQGVEDNYIQKTGQPLNAAVEDRLMRAYAYNYLDKSGLVPYHFSLKDKQTNANVLTRIELGYPPNTGGRATDNQYKWVYDATNAVQSGNKDALQQTFNQLFAGNSSKPYVNAGYINGGKQIVVAYQTGDIDKNRYLKIPEGLGKEKVSENPNYKKPVIDYETIDVDDPALKEKLAGIYQKTMGSNSKVENAPYYSEGRTAQPQQAEQQPQQQAPPQPQPKKSTKKKLSAIPDYISTHKGALD